MATDRSCGGCTACCQVVPVRELNLKAHQGCPHVRDMLNAAGPGCSIYSKRPRSCQAWNCGWLENDWEADLRPDRCGVVVDTILDLIMVDGVERPAAQLWVLRGHEEDYQKDPARALILAILHSGVAVIWRLPDGSGRGFYVAPDGKVCSGIAPYSKDAQLGPVAERIARAHKMADRANRIIAPKAAAPPDTTP
jgi:hypothetical protein